MATQYQVDQLLRGVAGRNPFRAFGITNWLPPADLRRECRRQMAIYHEDKGNTTTISQLANGCADVICGRQRELGDALVASASQLLHELEQNRAEERYELLRQRWIEMDKQARIDRVMSVENKWLAEKQQIIMKLRIRMRSSASRRENWNIWGYNT